MWDRMKKNLKIKLILTISFIVALGFFLRLYKLQGIYMNHESYVALTGALEIINGHGFSYEYYGSVGPALVMVIPFLIHASEWIGQLIIALYGALLVPLAYWFALRYGFSELEALIFPLIIAVSPFFVVLSRVSEYDIIGTFFTALFFIILSYAIRKPRSNIAVVLLAIFGCTIVLMRIVNLILVGPLMLVLAAKSLREKKLNFLLPLLVLVVGALIYLAIFPTERIKIFTGARGAFSFGFHVPAIAAATLSIIFSPLYTPKESIYFYTNFQRSFNQTPILMTTLVFIQLVFILVGFYVFYGRRRGVEFLSLTWGVMSLPLIFLFYRGWQARYILPSLFLTTFFLCVGVSSFINGLVARVKGLSSLRTFYFEFRRGSSIKILFKLPKGVFIAGLVFVIVLFSASILNEIYVSTGMLMDWGSESSLSEQNILIPVEECRRIFNEASISGVDIIASPLAVCFNFYSMQERVNITIFDVYKYAVHNMITPESVKSLMDWLDFQLSRGLKVWYVASWMEFTYYDVDGTLVGNFHEFLEALNQRFYLRTIFVGKIVRTETPGIVVYELLPKFVVPR